MNESAVTWLFDQMPKKLHSHYKKQLEQAKEMDRHRIINAVTFGQNNHTLSISDDLAIAEQYYNKTFKSE